MDRLLVALVFIAIFTMAVRVPVDTDSWWHLRSGQYVVENLAFFSADPFSHTQFGERWIYPKLGQVILYGFFALGGWTALSLLLAVSVTTAFALVWQVAEGNAFIKAFVFILGAVTSSLIWVARPQMFSFVLAALQLLWLERYKRQGESWIFGLPLLMIFWANVHGGFAIAFMLLGAYIVGESLNRITKHDQDPTLNWQQIGWLCVLGIVAFVAVVINPYGWQMWFYPFLTININALGNFIQEWQSPNFHTPITWPFVLMFSATLLVMGRSSRQTDWSDITLVGLWSAWSFFAVRNIGLYGLLITPILVRYGTAAFGHYLPEPTQRQYPILFRLNYLLLGLILFLALLWTGLMIAQNEKAIAESGLPVEAVGFIEQHQPSGPIFNSYNWGGYLLFQLWPDYPIYIDGRTDLYQDEFINRYLQVMTASENWSQILEDDGVNLVLVEDRSVIANVMRQESAWLEIYRDDLAVLFKRKIEIGGAQLGN